MIPMLLILVMAIASFAPPPIRGIVMILLGGLGMWYTMHTYTPNAKVPELPDTPETEEADDLIAKHAVAKSMDHTDALRKSLVDAVDQDKNPNFKK